MSRKDRFWIGFTITALALALIAGMGFGLVAEGHGDTPHGPDLAGSPTPVWEATPIPEVTETPVVVALPNTGAGTTARTVVSNEHTGWIFIGYSCPLFGEGRYAVYGNAYGHYPSGAHLYSEYRVYKISSWC